MAEIKAGALHYAAAKGDVKTILDLIDRGADIHAIDYDKRTALHVAAANGHTHAMEALVTRGTKLDAHDRWDRTALDEAIGGNHIDAVNFLQTRGIQAKPNGMLLKKQVSFQQIDPSSSLAMLFAAVIDGDINTVKQLIDNKRVGINDADDDRRSAVHLAASEGKLEILQYCILLRANINLKDRWGNRPINDAMRGHHTDCVELLIANGAISSEDQTMDKSDERNVQKMFTLKQVSKEALYELHQRGVREFWSWDRNDFEMESEPFGKGAGGEVFRARFREMEIVAKTLGKLSVGPEQLTDIANEIMLMASIRHPHIVSFYGACFQVSPPVMLIEYCPVGNLEMRILKAYNPDQPKRLSSAQKLKYTHQIALAMTFLHRFHVPITHRDLKPGNILITANDDIKVTDFGLAKFTPTEATTKGHYSMTGETGSYRFMAPEVFEHKPYDRKVDVYAFAMILYWLYMGVRPFVHHRDGVEAVKASARGQRPIINIKESKIEALIKLCWEHNPDLRPEFAAIARQCEEMKVTGVGRRVSRIFLALGIGDEDKPISTSLSPRSTESESEGRGSESLPSPPIRRKSFLAGLFGW